MSLTRGGKTEEESAAETVQSAALPLERVHDVHGGDGLALGVLSVRHSVADDILEEHLEDATGLFVDESRDALDAASARKTTDRWLGDALDVVSQNLAVTLGSSLSQTLSALTTTRHDEYGRRKTEKTDGHTNGEANASELTKAEPRSLFSSASADRRVPQGVIG